MNTIPLFGSINIGGAYRGLPHQRLLFMRGTSANANWTHQFALGATFLVLELLSMYLVVGKFFLPRWTTLIIADANIIQRKLCSLPFA
jgi:hypothetical protein